MPPFRNTKTLLFQSVDFKDFDLIWLSDPPEIGPYKMTAKSMMKVPELNKAPITTVIKKNVKKSTNSNSNTNNVATAVGGSSSNGHKGHHRLLRKSRAQLLLITSPQKKLVPLV